MESSCCYESNARANTDHMSEERGESCRSRLFPARENQIGKLLLASRKVVGC